MDSADYTGGIQMSKNSFFNILYVEDDEAQVIMMKTCLDTFEDIKVAHSWDGLEALNFLKERLENNEELPQMILLDMKMPRMDGIEFLAKLKENHKLASVPVVVITSSDSQTDIKRAYEGGASSYVVKPFGLDNLKKLLNKLIDYWFSTNTFIQRKE